MLDENINSKDDTKKYQVTRESKTGRMTATSIAAGLAVVLTVAGIGKIMVTELGNTLNKEKYSYDSEYDSYSEQIENIIGVDLDTSLEDELNSLETVRELIYDYQNNNSADALKLLKDQKYRIEAVSLGIAKKWCASEWGGDAAYYRITPISASMPGWVVTHPETGTHELPHGQIHNFLDYIGKLQGYSDEKIEQVDISDRFVKLCDDVVKYSGMVAADLSQGKSK